MSVMRMLKNGALNCAVDPPALLCVTGQSYPVVAAGFWSCFSVLRRIFLASQQRCGWDLLRQHVHSLCVSSHAALLSCRALKIWPFRSKRHDFKSLVAEATIKAGEGAKLASNTELPRCFSCCDQPGENVG